MRGVKHPECQILKNGMVVLGGVWGAEGGVGRSDMGEQRE